MQYNSQKRWYYQALLEILLGGYISANPPITTSPDTLLPFPID